MEPHFSFLDAPEEEAAFPAPLDARKRLTTSSCSATFAAHANSSEVSVRRREGDEEEGPEVADNGPRTSGGGGVEEEDA